MRSPASSCAATISGDRFASTAFLGCAGGRVDAGIDGLAKPLFEGLVMLAGVAPGDGQDFGRQQVQDKAIFVGRPYRAILAQEGGPGAFLAAKTERAIHQAIHEPLEPDRHFTQLDGPGRLPPGRSSSWRPASSLQRHSGRQPGRFWNR